MKKNHLKFLLAVVAFGMISCTTAVTQAGDHAYFGLEPLILKPNKCSPWIYGGHFESGLFVNQYGQKNAYDDRIDYAYGGADFDSGNTYLLQNVHQSDLQMNQLWAYFGKELNTRCGWDIGGRVDFAYGTDVRFLQSAGLEKHLGQSTDPAYQYLNGNSYWGSGDYFYALPQMYLELGNRNFSVKLGKFLSPMGHESIVSDERFFYSLSRSYGAVSHTHTGALATWKIDDKLSVFGGWVQGEDEFFNSSDNNGVLAGLEFQVNPHTKWGYACMIGKNSYVDPALGITAGDDLKTDYFVHSLYMTHKFNERWDYAFEWSLRNEVDKGKAQGIAFRETYGAYGIDQALYYKINCKWSVGLRLEWEHEIHEGCDIYSATFGANWKPTPWLLIRPEIRYDAIHGAGGHADLFGYAKSGYTNAKSEQLSGGFSTVIRF